MLKKVTTKVTYRVPDWEYCNLMQRGTLGKPSKELCRFCVKERGGYRCALYNEALNVTMGTMPLKAHSCERAVAGFNSVAMDVEQQPSTEVDPKKLISLTINEYIKTYNKFLSDGYPAVLAEKLAKASLTGR